MRQPVGLGAFRAHSLQVTTRSLQLQRRLSSTQSLTTFQPYPTTKANPPWTTRPPPLDLPIRQPETSSIKHWYSTGKAYLTFYKTGLKNIFVNRRLIRGTTTNPDESAISPEPDTRAHWQLYLRTKHDMRLLPLFGVLLLLCEEFTPLVILLMPRIAPYTCRTPKQIEVILKKDEEARSRIRAHLRELVIEHRSPTKKQYSVALGRIIGVLPKNIPLPRFIVEPLLERRLAYIRDEDKMLVAAGGAKTLNPEELKLACSFRGINILGRADEDLKAVLERWLRLSCESKPSGTLGQSLSKLGYAGLNVDEAAQVLVLHSMILHEDHQWNMAVEEALR